MPPRPKPGTRTASNARESYFFGKGQRELAAAIKAAWSTNLAEAERDWSNARRAWVNGEFKKQDYANQSLAMPKEVAAKKADWYPSGAWNFESINKRQKYLAQTYARRVWKIHW